MINPKISIILPVYNGEKYIALTINSILNQTFKDFELIIINDCSSDKSKKIILSYEDKRILYIENYKNIGQISSINKGIKLSNASLIARVDQDDIFEKEKLEIQFNFLNENPNITVVGTWANIINSDGNLIRKLSIPDENNQMINVLLNSNPLFHPSVIFRKEVVLELGLYNKKYEFTEDYDLWCNIVMSGYKIANIPKFLIKYREHSDQSSKKNQEKQLQNALKIRSKFFIKISNELVSAEKFILKDFNKKELSEIAYTCSEILAQKKIFYDSLKLLYISFNYNKFNFKSLLMILLLKINNKIYYKYVIHKNILRSKLVE